MRSEPITLRRHICTLAAWRSESVDQHNSNNSRLRFWQILALSLALLLATAAVAIARFSIPVYRNLSESVAQLSSEVAHLRQEQHSGISASALLARYRGSICFIYAAYVIDRPAHAYGSRRVHVRVSGTGFVVADGIVASNKHVLQPDFDDPEAVRFIRAGAKPRPEKIVAFFPGVDEPIRLEEIRAADSADLAIARLGQSAASPQLIPIPLASSPSAPGDSVVVIGYPMGVAGMVAKSPRTTYERLALATGTVNIAHDLAALSLIRPSATFGHVGDLVGDKLLYDAQTAQGGSGGPVFNARGEVIAINSGYIKGFAGGTLGISAEDLRSLLRAATVISRTLQ